MEESVPDKKQFQYSVTSGLSAQVGGAMNRAVASNLLQERSHEEMLYME